GGRRDGGASSPGLLAGSARVPLAGAHRVCFTGARLLPAVTTTASPIALGWPSLVVPDAGLGVGFLVGHQRAPRLAYALLTADESALAEAGHGLAVGQRRVVAVAQVPQHDDE